MRILVNDYPGHAFPIQLSRSLAKRGYDVLHSYCSSVQAPRGNLDDDPANSRNLKIHAIDLGRPFNKYGWITRWRQEKELGKRLCELCKEFSPSMVISANTPLGAQAELIKAARQSDARFIFWLQDVLGIGIRKALRKQLPIAGDIIGWLFQAYERRLWRISDEVIVITEDFVPLLPRKHLDNSTVTVVENWAPLDEIQTAPKRNPWSAQHKLEEKLVFLYSGTLGLKHNPQLILELALDMQSRDDVVIVVLSEGIGADWLVRRKQECRLDNLLVMGFVPFDVLPEAFASADVLLAILEPDASIFAVPSKVMTYMCADRPLLLAVSSENLAARIVHDNDTGIVVSPTDETAFLHAANTLVADSRLRARLARNAREYAECTYDIEAITDVFENIIIKSSKAVDSTALTSTPLEQ